MEATRNHDNASPQMARSMREFLATKQITVLENPDYSPDLAPNDFFLFPIIKEILKGRHFDNIDDVRSNTTAALNDIPQNQFQNCFEGWTRRWHQCTVPKWSTLKATMVVISKDVCSNFTTMGLRTLLSDHVCTHLGPYRLRKSLNSLLHTSQLHGRTPVCTRLRSFSLYFSLNVLLTRHSYMDAHQYEHVDVSSGHICN